MVSPPEIKRIALSIEEELFAYYGEVNTKYKHKFRTMITHLKDPKNLASSLFSLLEYAHVFCIFNHYTHLYDWMWSIKWWLWQWPWVAFAYHIGYLQNFSLKYFLYTCVAFDQIE